VGRETSKGIHYRQCAWGFGSFQYQEEVRTSGQLCAEGGCVSRDGKSQTEAYGSDDVRSILAPREPGSDAVSPVVLGHG